MSVRLGLVMAVLFCFVYEASCRRSGLVLSHLTGKPVEGNWRFVLAGGRSLQAQGIQSTVLFKDGGITLQYCGRRWTGGYSFRDNGHANWHLQLRFHTPCEAAISYETIRQNFASCQDVTVGFGGSQLSCRDSRRNLVLVLRKI